jgi:hypothetical protein
MVVERRHEARQVPSWLIFDVSQKDPVEIPAFAEITYRVLANTPLSEFAPTVCFPERRQIQTLSGVPPEEEERMRDISLEWAASKAKGGEEFLVAFRDGNACFRIIRSYQGELHEALFPEKKNG